MTELRDNWLNSYSSGRLWLNKLGSPHTKKKFTEYFWTYCEAVKKTPDELIALKIEGLQNVGTVKEWQAEDLLEGFFAQTDMKPTAKLMLKNSVFSFYKHNRRALEAQTASNVKNETPESKKRKPTLEDLKNLENAGHLARDKAIVWFIASTSCRVGTVALLNWQDLKPTGNPEVPYSLEIESKRLKGAGIGKYKGLKQITFLHKYASEKLEAYKQEAKLKGYDLKPESPLFIRYWNKGEIKRLAPKAFGLFFDNLSLNAWGDLEQKRFSPHDLREFFQSAMENAGVNPNTISPIMRHKVKGVDQHYSSHDIEELLVKYQTALPWMVLETVEQVKAETQKKLDAEQKLITNLEYENTELKSKMNSLNTRQESTEGELALLKKYVFTVGGVVETKEDIKELQGFLEKMRKEKEQKNEVKPWEEE